jgi:hypothetical protein
VTPVDVFVDISALTGPVVVSGEKSKGAGLAEVTSGGRVVGLVTEIEAKLVIGRNAKQVGVKQ